VVAVDRDFSRVPSLAVHDPREEVNGDPEN
jgi:hypothetical protein